MCSVMIVTIRYSKLITEVLNAKSRITPRAIISLKRLDEELEHYRAAPASCFRTFSNRAHRALYRSAPRQLGARTTACPGQRGALYTPLAGAYIALGGWASSPAIRGRLQSVVRSRGSRVSSTPSHEFWPARARAQAALDWRFCGMSAISPLANCPFMSGRS